MIYVPHLEHYNCFVVRNESTIRAYKNIPQNNMDIEYRDYYINSNYLYQDGVQSFGPYSTLPICLDNSNLTNNVYYRNDFDSILVIFLIMCIFCFYLPLKIFVRLFSRFQ